MGSGSCLEVGTGFRGKESSLLLDSVELVEGAGDALLSVLTEFSSLSIRGRTTGGLRRNLRAVFGGLESGFMGVIKLKVSSLGDLV